MAHDDRFSTTHWSMILQAGDKAHPAATEALEDLCRRYWFPLYAFVRREGYGEHDAQDLTQDFFAAFLSKDYLRGVDPGRGRFRAFLLASIKHFLSNARDRAGAAKRGGGRTVLSIDFARAEDRYAHEPAIRWTPEMVFDRRWALETLRAVLSRLQSEWDDPGRREFFAAVEGSIAGGTPTRTNAEIAHEFDMTEGAVKTAVHRLRRRYRDLLREEISRTVADPADVDEEIRDLFAALKGP